MGKSIAKKAARAAFAASIARTAPMTFSTKKRLEILRVDEEAEALKRAERKDVPGGGETDADWKADAAANRRYDWTPLPGKAKQ